MKLHSSLEVPNTNDNGNNPAEDWQNINKTLGECVAHMLKNELETDVKFYVGPEREKFACHKLILASRSSVFYNMLFGPLAEGNEIELPDIKPEGFKNLLRYTY